MKKKINIILMTALIILCFSGCNNLNSNQKLKVTDIPWKVKMGINYLDDRAAMVEYTNNTEYTITEIAEIVGFSDAKYFREVFKKYYNVSPSKFVNSDQE